MESFIERYVTNIITLLDFLYHIIQVYVFSDILIIKYLSGCQIIIMYNVFNVVQFSTTSDEALEMCVTF